MANPEYPLSPRTGRPLIPREPARRGERCGEGPPAALVHGVALFNQGDYWDCHEVLEDLWRDEPDPVRYLYQGVLLVGVGLHHLQRGNRHGAVTKLRAGAALLAPYEPSCQGVDVTALRRAASAVLDIVEDTPAGRPSTAFTKVQIAIDPTAGAGEDV